MKDNWSILDFPYMSENAIILQVYKEKCVQMKKTQYLSTLNVISAIAVVILHTNGCFWTYSADRYWATANVLESVMYFAVPVFFMISGATLLDYRERYSTAEYFKKRALKALIPWFFWATVGLVIALLTPVLYNVDTSWRGIIDAYMNSRMNGTYWFFFPLFSIYLTIPVISLIPKEKRIPIFTYVAGIHLLLSTFLPFFANKLQFSYNSSIEIMTGKNYFLFIVLGYLLHHIDFKRWQRAVLYVLSLGGLLTHLLGTYVLSREAGYIVQTYKGYMAFPSIFYAVGVFVFFKYLHLPAWVEKGVNYLAKYTFAIYLIHWYVLKIWVYYGGIDTRSMVWRLLGVIPIAAICMLIARLLRFVPGLRKVVP